MLEALSIRNLALVSQLNMEFQEGFNVVTGETGAGKSLIIGAVQLLTGARATPAMIRKGEKSCEVAGMIALTSPRSKALADKVAAYLSENGLPPMEEDRLLIRRVITESSSRAYVNGALVTASALKAITTDLIDLHGPHDNQTLLLSSRQLELLDCFAGLQQESKSAKECFTRLSAIRQERETLKKAGLTPEELSLLQYQLKEITDANVSTTEEEDLLRRYKLAANSQDLLENAQQASQMLAGDDESSAAEKLSAALRLLRDFADQDPDRGPELVQRLENLEENLRELGSDFEAYGQSLELNPAELQEMENRLDLLQKLKRKYGPTLQDVLDTKQRLSQRIAQIENRSGRLQELEEAEEKTGKDFQQICKILSQKRTEAAPALSQAIQEKLRVLGFLKAGFRILIQPAPPSGSGDTTAVFRFSPNQGELEQDLKETASSGEIARVMLAIKTVLSDADQVPVLIFDEIDANIGGTVAVTVAKELHDIAKKHQVFSITHLPQIAAAGDMHYLVEKSISNERTETHMIPLEHQQRVDELVRMLGAEANSAPAREHAENLLQNFGRQS